MMAMNHRKERFIRDKEEIEKNIEDITDLYGGMEIDTNIAKAIRSESEKRDIDDIDMKSIAGSNVKHKEPKVRIKRYRIDDSLFPDNVKKGLREEYLIKALTYILENRIEV